MLDGILIKAFLTTVWVISIFSMDVQRFYVNDKRAETIKTNLGAIYHFPLFGVIETKKKKKKKKNTATNERKTCMKEIIKIQNSNFFKSIQLRQYE